MREPHVITLIHDLLGWLANDAAPVVLWLTTACAVVGLTLATVWVTVHAVARRAPGHRGGLGRAGRYLDITPQWHPTGSDRDVYGDAAEFWTEVAAAMRSVWWRPVRYVVFELTVTRDTVRAGLWVPDHVNAQRIAHAITSAWRGTSVQITEPDTRRGLADKPLVVRRMAPRRSLLASANTSTHAGPSKDPLGRVVDQARYMQPGDSCVLRVSVAPARPTQLDREASRDTWRSPIRQIGEDVQRVRNQFPSPRDWWHGTHSRPSTGPSPASTNAAAPKHGGLAALPDRPIWHVTMLLLGVAGAGRPRTAGHLVDEIAGAFGAFRGRTGFATQHVDRPARHLAEKRPPDPGGFLATNTELATLVHLPNQDDVGTTTGEPAGTPPVPDSLIADDQPIGPSPELVAGRWTTDEPDPSDHDQRYDQQPDRSPA